MGLSVGIDLGTTYSAVAFVDDSGLPRIIKSDEGESTTPSVLCFSDDGSVVFGLEAKQLQEFGDANAASFYKRDMGNPNYSVEYAGRTYSPTELSSIFLKKLVEQASREVGQKIDSAVITVPAYFAARERQATIEAGKLAGLNVIALLSEPSAAAYAYGLTGGTERKKILIYDLGGGTFDVTIAEIDKSEVRVLGCDGNHRLGGKDWDDALATHLLQAMCDEVDIDYEDINLTQQEMNALIVQAEQAKRQLSAREKVQLKVSASGQSAVVEATRDDFEKCTAHLLRMTIDVIEKLLLELNLGWQDIDGTLLVGGSTRMPAVKAYLRDSTGKESLSGINPDEAVALGAAIRANMESKPQFSLAGGAQTFKLRGAKTLIDSTAHAMGMIAESEDRSRYVNSTIIPRHSSIPACMKREYSLRVPSKGGELEVYVLQGSNERVLDNVVYAKYVVEGIEREASGESTVEVSYEYTENATIEVSARQPRINKSLLIRQEPVEDDLSRFDGAPPALESIVDEGPQLYITLSVDVSGSMSGAPLTKAKESMRDFVDSFEESDAKISVLPFSDSCSLFCKPTDNYNEVREAISRIEIAVYGMGYGNAADPIAYWFANIYSCTPESEKDETFSFKKRNIKKRSKERPVHNCLIVLTDGVWPCQKSAISNAKAAATEGADIIAIGFGDAEERFLRKIATSDDLATLTSVNQLSETFSTIGRALASGSGLSLR